MPRARARLLLFASLALCSMGAPIEQGASAQAAASKPFEPTKHLPGYDDAVFSEWSDLYRLDEFTKLEGKVLGESELASVRARWESEKARVEATLTEMRADPRKFGLFRLERDRKKHLYFAKVACTRFDDHAPFVLYVQRPSVEQPGYEAGLAAEYGALLTELAQRFEREWAVPLGLARRPDAAVLPVFVLASPGDLENYLRLAPSEEHFRAHGSFDAALKAPVLFEDPFQPRRDREERRRSALHFGAHALQQAYWGGESYAPTLAWLLEGWAHEAATVGWPLVMPPAPKDAPVDAPPASAPVPLTRPDRAAVATLSTGLREEQPWAHFQPFSELLLAVDYDSLWSKYTYARGELDPESVAPVHPYDAYLAHAALRVHFLRHAENGRYRPAFERHLAGFSKGDLVLAKAAALYAPATPADIDAAFLGWLAEVRRAAAPGEPIDPAAVMAALAATAPKGAVVAPVGVGGGAAGRGPGAARPGPAPADPRALLAIPTSDHEARFALALADVTAGRAQAALAALAALREAADDALAARIDRERARLEPWVALRDRWLADLAKAGEKLALEQDGKTQRLTVAKVEEGSIHFAANKAGIERLEVESLDPRALAAQMSKRAAELAPAWVRAYPYLLADDAKWKPLAKGDEPEARALRADAAADYPPRLRLGRAASELVALAALAPPEGEAAARDRIGRLRALVSENKELPLVRERALALRALAAEAYERLFDALGPGAALAAKILPLDGGRVRVIYEFDAAGELDDFEPAPYLAERRKSSYQPLLGEHTDAFAVADGALHGSGAACLRHRLGFLAPAALRMKLAYSQAPGQATNSLYVYAALGDDGDEHYAASTPHGDIYLFQPSGSARSLVSPDGQRIEFEREYDVLLKYDGKAKIETSSDGQPLASLPCEPLAGSGVFLWIHSDYPVHVTRLEIEGHLDPVALEHLAAVWVEAEMKDF